MSLATSIKDFSDTLNHIHTVKTSSLPILPFLQELVVFSVNTVISGIFYILKFEWFRDFIYLPLVNPVSQQPFQMANAERLLFPSIAPEYLRNSFFTDPLSHFFSFFNIPANTANYFVSGISNSFFFSLPFSLPHLISIRRLFSQGIQAAFASLVGIIAAHSLFLISIFYGLRFFIIPWFSLEPITYILGFTINILVIKELIQTSPQRFKKGGTVINSQPFSLTPFSRKGGQSQKRTASKVFTFSPLLLRIGVYSFVLTWCEELNVFSCITGLTFNAQNTYLDLYPSINASQFFGIHTIYIFSFIVGNLAFSLLFYYLFLKSGPVIASWTNLSSTRISDTINKLVMLAIITFTFASFPYYGLDYLFGKVGGFLPEDPIYKDSVLSPTKLTMNKKNTLFIKAESADKKKHTSLLDVNNFDNGIYLNNIDSYKLDNFPSDSKGSLGRTTSFEKSNYRQENAWIRRNYLARLRARPRKNSDNSSTTSLYKTFKDPKAYYQKMQLESDRKQNKSIREIQAKNSSGYFVKRQEGILAEEPVSRMQDFWDRVFGFPGDIFLQTNVKKIDPQVTKQGNTSATVFTGRGQETNMSLNNQKLKEDKYIKLEPSSVETEVREGGGFLTTSAQPKRQSSLDFVPTFQQNNTSGQRDDELDFETNIFAEKYTKGIQKKSSLPLLKKTKSLSTKNIIKRKFFLNPVYRALLQTDIDTFMARQPSTHNVAENQDHDLYKKRILLEKYYNWLRYYSPLQKDLQNVYNISESKSFVDSVFHHQFKGTLKIAKRLFPVTFDPQQNRKRNRVLSYDQTLYKDLANSENPLLHEELLPSPKQEESITKARKASLNESRDQPKRDPVTVQTKESFLTSLTKPSETVPKPKENKTEGFGTVSEAFGTHPKAFSQPNSSELDSKLQLKGSQVNEGVLPKQKATFLRGSSTNNSSKEGLPEKSSGVYSPNSLNHISNNSPFIEESDSAPFYAGWDETLRRFVITNQFFIEK